jgi:hypothetical protein
MDLDGLQTNDRGTTRLTATRNVLSKRTVQNKPPTVDCNKAAVVTAVSQAGAGEHIAHQYR